MLILAAIGNTVDPEIIAGVEKYAKRIARYMKFEIHCLPDIKNPPRESEALKKSEETTIRKWLKPNDTLVLLDEYGKEFTSKQFSAFMEHKLATLRGRLIFIIGGAYGFSESLKKEFESVSLSKLTFPHQMVRLIAVEQLYRAFTIAKGEPYHHD